MMKELTVAQLYTLEETIARDIFQGVTYPWEVLPKIGCLYQGAGRDLPAEEYDKVGEDVWIASPPPCLSPLISTGPAIIGKNCGGAPVRLHPGQRHCGRGSCGGEFHEA